MLIRNGYLDKLLKYKDKQIIKVITGMRRSGKSVLLRQYQEQLLADGVQSEQIIAVNFEDIANRELLDHVKLHDYVTARITDDRQYYIFLDEIQLVGGFQRTIDSLFLRENVDIYLTGSNAYMLSGELATLLSGRYVEIKVMPFSFAEYLSYTGLEKHEAWSRYFLGGGFPFLARTADEEIRTDYLNGIYNTVLLKDVVGRCHIKDVSLLESVVRFLLDNIGNIVSAKKIADSLTSYGRKTTAVTVDNFIKALTDAFLLYKAERYDVKGKQHLKSLEKYYVGDIGLRQILTGNRYRDYGQILENVVYLELIRRGNKLYVGKWDALEVDFVAERNGTLAYYQVTMSLQDEGVYQREIAPLLKIRDAWPKYILTLDELQGNDNGVQIVNAREWMS